MSIYPEWSEERIKWAINNATGTYFNGFADSLKVDALGYHFGFSIHRSTIFHIFGRFDEAMKKWGSVYRTWDDGNDILKVECLVPSALMADFNDFMLGLPTRSEKERISLSIFNGIGD